MKTSQVIMSALIVLLAASQTACSAKIEGSSSNDLPNLGPGPQNAGFNIESLDGQWKTGCVKDIPGYPMEQFLTLSGGNYTSVAKMYMGAECEQAALYDTQTKSGRFVAGLESPTEPGSYQIDIETPQGPNVTAIEYDLARIEDGKLYLGDYMAPYNGNYPSKVNKKLAFTK